jgi:hypothetical protein
VKRIHLGVILGLTGQAEQDGVILGLIGQAEQEAAACMDGRRLLHKHCALVVMFPCTKYCP